MRRRIERRSRIRAGARIVFLLFLLSIPFTGTPVVLGQEELLPLETTSSLEQQILEGMKRGEAVAEEVSRWTELRAGAPRRPERSRSREAAELRQALAGFQQRSRPLVGSGARPAAGQILALLPAYDALRAADLLFRERFTTVAAKLEQAGVGDEIVARLNAAEARYYEQRDRFLTPLEGPMEALRSARDAGETASVEMQTAALSALAATRGWLAENLEDEVPVILRTSLLPYGPGQLAPRELVDTPTLVPSYLDPSDPAPLAADLAPTLEAPFSEAILRQADELGNDYVRIYEFVRNEIDTEWYAGSMKGAEGALLQRSGNDVDQASLLTALLRASQAAARYVQGIIELPIETLAADLGVAEGDVTTVLSRSGVAHEVVIRGGRIAAIELEHTWVSVHVPYANYRGAVVDFSGPIWLPLFPALKRYQHTPASGVLGDMGLTADEVLTDYLSVPQSREPLAELRQRVEDYLEQNAQGVSYEDQLATRTLVGEVLGLLPSSLPVEVVAVTAEQAELADTKRHRVRVVVRAGESETDPVLLDHTVTLGEILGGRVTLSYQPATVDDQTTVNLFGGLDAVPLYLIELRPRFMIGGRIAAVGEGADSGIRQRLEIELTGPFGSESVSQTLISGNYYALALTGQQDEPKPVVEDDPADSEQLGARLLSQVALGYSRRWGESEEELGRLLDVAVFRPLPALAIAANAVDVEMLFGLPIELDWEGVTLDAAMRVAEPLARTGDPSLGPDWMRLSALQGSAVEHFLFEDEFLVDSISADKGLGLARDAGIEVVTIDDQNIGTLLPLLLHPTKVVEEIENWVRLGMVVEVPVEPITHNAWSGSVWRVEDPATGAGGYFIAGGLAGGATTEEDWILDFLEDAFGSPNSPPPNTDPLAGVEIVKIGASDGQQGTVDEVLPKQLGVQVRDKDGRPVKEAPVEFSVTTGGGKLIDSEGAEVDSLVVLTNEQGIALVGFKLGKSTSESPVYTLRNPDDKYATQALQNYVDALGIGAAGPLVPVSPFQALALPGEPAELVVTDGASPFGTAGLWSASVDVRVDDEFNNPVSNVPVTYAVGAAVPQCSNVGAFDNAVVFDNTSDATGPAACLIDQPVLGDCGVPAYTDTSSVRGTNAGIILGSAASTIYNVDATSPGLSPQSFAVESFGPCNGGPIVGYNTTNLADEFGNNISAAKTGETYKRPVQVTLLYSDPDFVVKVDSQGEYYIDYLPTSTWVRTTGNVVFNVASGGSASPAVFVGDGTYETLVTTGPAPTSNLVSFNGTQIQVTLDRVNKDTGEVFQETVERALSGDLFPVWGVDPTILQITPDPLILTSAGRTVEEGAVHYQILPTLYSSFFSNVDLLEEGEITATAIADRTGEGSVSIPRGFTFDINKSYETRMILNRGSDAEVKGDPEPVPLYQQIFENVDRAISVSQDVDLLNERICAFGSNFTYTTTQEATITLKFKRIQSENPDGSPNFGDEEIFIDGELQPPGDHEFPITPSDLLPADYVFELIGVSSVDGHEEIVEGFARSEFKTRDSLPVGHVVVKGVDLFTGHLSVARQDFQLPGRGVPIGFSRHYSSNSPTDGGSLGIGWSHSLGSRIILTPCGEAIVIGGQGSGQRFVDDGQGGLRPLSGFHGSLVGNTEDNTFDFYSKDGTRHHYVSSSPREWRIEFVADTNGNATEYVYDSTGKDANLVAVRDSGGRTIQLVYEEKLFRYWGGDVITSVTASGDYAISFEYDEYGNLTLASREEGVQVESYAYATEPDDPFEDRHLLTSTTNELNGATTSYGYERATIGIQGNVQIPSVFVSQLMEPEGGITAFTYDLTSLSSRGPPQLTTQVTDPRDQITSYTLNQYGSPREIVDPEGNTTAMTWATDDVVMLSSTDGNDITTTFTYDDHANLKSETVTVTHFDGSTDTFITLKTYKLPTAFDPPYLKSRVHTRTNRNGAVTTFDYDAHGNLTSEEITVQTVDGSRTYVTSHTYESNGDRKSTTDPRNFTTFFSYDAYGNLSRVTDPEDHQSETIFNIRSQPETQIDALNRTTTFRYDSLNRRTATIYPDDTVEETLYDDINRQIFETDGEDRVTRSDYDLEGRVLRIVNAEDGIKEFEFDLAGNKTLESSWFDQDTPRFDTIFTYDNAGRLQTRTEPLGRITTYSYDGVGNVTNETIVGPGMAPRVTNTSYDGLNRPIVITQQNNDGPVVTKIKYDGEGNRVLEVDPLERETSSQYDGLNRLIQKTEPLGRITQFLYDGNGNLLEERRANTTGEQVRIFEYDRNNRLTSRKDALKEETIFEYDPAGNIERRIDPRLHVITFDYDDRDRLEKETRKRALGDVVTEFDYDRVGNLTEQRLPNNNVIIRTYDELNRLKTESDTLGPLATFDYDARGNIIEQTDANDNLAETDYDELDRVTEQRLPEDRKLTFTYDAVDNVLTRTDARRNTTTFEYDRLNRLTKTVDPAPFSYTVESEYDRAGNRLSEKDRRGNVTVFEYDDLNRLERIIDPPPLSFVREFTYDTLGNQITEKDRRDILLEFEYDLENRLLKTTRAGLVIEEIEYDQNGNRRFVTDANRNITGFEYDELDRLTAENRPLAAITRFTLDEIGNIREERDPENRITVRDYDLRQRLTIETNDANETTEFGYDDNGNRTSVRRPEQNEWVSIYDGADRLREVTDPTNETTAYGYDGNDNLTSVLDANNNETTFEYDELDRRTAKNHADTAREETDYDGNGNVTEIRDPLGQTIHLIYDVLDRLESQTFLGAQTVTGDDLQSISTIYDPNGNPLTITEAYSGATGLRVTSQTWDDFDRLFSVTDPNNETLTYGYDANGNRTQLQDPDGRVTTYVYDALNRVDMVTMSLVGITDYDYLRNSLLESIAYPNGSKAEYQYDRANRFSSITNTQSGALVSSYEYEFDLNGNRTKQTEVNGGPAEITTYSYDTADRLLVVAYPDKTTTYVYDAVGNRISEQETDLIGTPLTDKTLIYDSRNRIAEVTDNLDPTLTATYAWDANGNQISKTRNEITTGFAYDIRDQLASVTQGGGPLAIFAYDYQGLRVRKETPASTLLYVYDDRSVLLQTDTAGDTIAKYDYGPDRLLSLGHVTEPRQFYLFDGLESVVDVTRTDGGVQARYQYDAWGNPRATVGASFNPFGFTGQERDDETGLYYFKARFYDPEIGRFLTEDPIEGDASNPPSLHKYLYAQANPTVFVDPSGEVVETVWDVASLGIGVFSLVNNVRKGNWGSAALDALGVVADAAAVAIPFVPGGAGAAIKAGRAAKLGVDLVKAKRTVDVIQTVDQAASATQGAVAAVEEFEDGNYGWSAFNATMALVGAKQTASNANQVARGTRSAPTPNKAPEPPATKTDVKPQGKITGEAGKGGTNAASGVSRKSAAPDASEQKLLPPGRQPRALLPERVAPPSKSPDFVVDPAGRTASVDDLRRLATARQAKAVKGATSNTIGQKGEDFLEGMVRGQGKPQKTFDTSLGGRRVDQRVVDTNFEVKNTSGRQANTQFFRRQLAKEKELLQKGGAEGAEKSVLVGIGGFSKKAQDEAQKVGVDILDLEKFPDTRDFPFD